MMYFATTCCGLPNLVHSEESLSSGGTRYTETCTNCGATTTSTLTFTASGADSTFTAAPVYSGQGMQE